MEYVQMLKGIAGDTLPKILTLKDCLCHCKNADIDVEVRSHPTLLYEMFLVIFQLIFYHCSDFNKLIDLQLTIKVISIHKNSQFINR